MNLKPQISIPSKATSWEVPVQSNLMKSIQSKHIPVASSCDGDGVCKKCKVKIIQGLEFVNSPTHIEEEWFLKNPDQIGYRLSCQVKVNGPIAVDSDYW